MTEDFTRMFPRKGGKKLLVGVAALFIFAVLFFEGQHLAGDTLRHQLSNYSYFLHSRLGSSSASSSSSSSSSSQDLDNHPPPLRLGPPLNLPTPPPPTETTTPFWQNLAYAKRRLQSENVCSRLREGSVVRLTRFGNTSYCVVPKVGCTFWLNVFRFLHGDTGHKNVTSPFDIPRMITHYGHMKSMRYFLTNSTHVPKHLVSDLRFMFVRDPYSRLWSAYVDKFLLIDYWRSEGRNIVKIRPKKDNTTMCARDISFKEFLEFVSTRPNPRALNEHWRPIQYQCSPCLYHPHIIGKLETFFQDSRYVLDLMNASWILDSYDHQLHVYQEMDMLINYNFHVLKSQHYKNCSNATDLARRLWRTFQINGYLPIEMNFPDPGPEGINASQFQKLAHNAYKNRPKKSSGEWKEQREQMMVDAFKDISVSTLEKLKKLYKEDFEMFGYDPEPKSIFANRKKIVKVKS